MEAERLAFLAAKRNEEQKKIDNEFKTKFPNIDVNNNVEYTRRSGGLIDKRGKIIKKLNDNGLSRYYIEAKNQFDNPSGQYFTITKNTKLKK
jgi:hypothetical protein